MKVKSSSLLYVVWMAIFTLVPMALVMVFAFTDKSWHFTLENIINVGQYSNIFLRSIGLGALSTVLCLLLGYPLAYVISKVSPQRQGIAIMLIMLPMWMNFLLRTYAWMTSLENNGLLFVHKPLRGGCFGDGLQLFAVYGVANLLGHFEDR